MQILSYLFDLFIQALEKYGFFKGSYLGIGDCSDVILSIPEAMIL